MADSNTFEVFLKTRSDLAGIQALKKELEGVRQAAVTAGGDTSALDSELAQLNKTYGEKYVEAYTEHLRAQVAATKQAGQDTAQLEQRLQALTAATQAQTAAATARARAEQQVTKVTDEELAQSKARADFTLEWEEMIQSMAEGEGVQKKSTLAVKESTDATHHASKEVQALRMAASAGQEATWAFQALMRGDYVIAMHEAKFATIGLNTAMKANPLGLLVATATAAMGAIHFISDAFTEQRKKVEETNKEHEKFLGNLTTLSNQRTVLSDLGQSGTELSLAMEKAAAATERQSTAMGETLKRFQELQAAQAAVEDAQLGVDMARIDADPSLSAEERIKRKGAARGRSDERKEDINQATIAGQISNSEARARGAANNERDARLRRDDLGKTISGKEEQQRREALEATLADQQGRGLDARDHAANAEALAKEVEELKAEYAKRVEAVKKARENEEKIATESSAEVAILKDKAAAGLKILTLRQEQQKIEEGAAVKSAKDVETAKQREAARQKIDLQLQTPGLSPKQKDDLERQKSGLRYQDASAITDPAERQRQQDQVREQEKMRRFQQLPVEQQIGAEASDAVKSRVKDVSYAGNRSREVERLSKGLKDGDQGDETKQIIDLLQQLADDRTLEKRERQLIKSRLEQIQRQIQSRS